jgi:hypothetical protein
LLDDDIKSCGKIMDDLEPAIIRLEAEVIGRPAYFLATNSIELFEMFSTNAHSGMNTTPPARIKNEIAKIRY